MTVASNEPIPWARRCVSVGEWRITALSDGYMRLDGGGMWGVVPKSMWSKWTPALEDNTILLALRPFLAEAIAGVIPNAAVLSYQETSSAKRVESVQHVELPAATT